MELTYTRQGDYLLPDLALRPLQEEPLNKYAKMRRTYLQEQKPGLYSTLAMTEELFPHLYQISRQSEQMLENLMTSLLEKNPAPNRMKNPMGWVKHMNSLKQQAEETILAELVYS